jgi:hypothetical protein
MRPAAFAGGLLFATLQSCYFLLLEWQLSSAWTTYATVTLAWMAGILAGLRLRGGDAVLLWANLPCYYGLWWLLRRAPYDDRLLPLCGLCVLASGAYAGRFFKASVARGKDVRAFLLHENNGFVAGLLLAFAGFSWDAKRFLGLGPAAGVCLLGLLARRSRNW